MSIEDEIFADILTALRINLTKNMYTKAQYPHKCSLCAEESNELGYKLKISERKIVNDYVIYDGPEINTPYLFICKECYEELPNEL